MTRIGNTLSRLAWHARLRWLRLKHRTRVRRSAARLAYEFEVLRVVARDYRPRRILSVGVATYTGHYDRLFPDARYETIDTDPAVARWGGRGGHQVGDARKLADLYEAAAFDVVLFNGVYGWGTNTADDLRAALAGVSHVLRDDGLLVFGWNCVPERDPLALERGVEAWLPGFRAVPIDGREAIDVERSHRHRFRFFTREPR